MISTAVNSSGQSRHEIKKYMQEQILVFIFGALGLLLTGGALANIISTFRFLLRAQKTNGTVVSYKSKTVTSGKHHRRSRTVYMPVIEYAPVETDNKKITITSTVGSNPPAYNIGELVTVYFLPGNPHRGKLNSFWELWFFPLVVFVIGCFICFFAYVIWANQFR